MMFKTFGKIEHFVNLYQSNIINYGTTTFDTLSLQENIFICQRIKPDLKADSEMPFILN